MNLSRVKFSWIKRYMPRSLYGRAALILILPVVVVQLVVSVVFIQRHLEDVTTQMSLTVVRELQLIANQVAMSPDRQTMLTQMSAPLETLQMAIRFVEPNTVPVQDQIRWYDFSARVVIATLRATLPQTRAAMFPDNRQVIYFFQSHLGPVELSFGRRRVTAAAPHQLILTMVFFGGLMTVIAFLYMRNQLRPITRLARAAQAFGRGQRTPYTLRGATEVRAAGAAFLDMRARIERQIEQRTMMLSGVSHDLRTPLTRLKLGLSMLDGDDVALLLGDVDEMEQMLDAFLDFSRDAAEGETELIDPRALITQVVIDAARAGKPVILGKLVGEGDVALRPTTLRRAIENLIGNAIRYGGGTVEVSMTLTDKSLRVRVEDDGPGIASDQRADAVRPFVRLDPARNQNLGGGVGLGLAIVADIARAHGGALRLGESKSLGGLRADIVIGR